MNFKALAFAVVGAIVSAFYGLEAVLSYTKPMALLRPCWSKWPFVVLAPTSFFAMQPASAKAVLAATRPMRPNNSFKPNPLRGFVLNFSQTVAAPPTGSSRSGSA